MVSALNYESNPTTWRLVAMNLAIRGYRFNLARKLPTPSRSTSISTSRLITCWPILRSNISGWWSAKLEGDKRWAFRTPLTGNANYAWLQHILWHLKPTGQAGVVLANGSMSFSQNSEGDIRRRMVKGGVVEGMVALPTQLFLNTQILACPWFLTRDKTAHGRDRRREFLFIDARKLGQIETRVHRIFSEADVALIADTAHRWCQDGETEGAYEDVPGFCRSVKLEELQEHSYVLTPGCYVGAEAVEDNDAFFVKKMERLIAQLAEQMAEGAELDAAIRKKLGRWSQPRSWTFSRRPAWTSQTLAFCRTNSEKMYES